MYSISRPTTPIPFLDGTSVRAGFTSTAEDYIVKPLSLDELLLLDPVATIFLKSAGWSMVEAGIPDGAVLAVNRKLSWHHGYVVVAEIDNEFTVKYFYNQAGKIKLIPANPAFPEIVPREGQEWKRIGVVTGAIVVFPPAKLAMSDHVCIA